MEPSHTHNENQPPDTAAGTPSRAATQAAQGATPVPSNMAEDESITPDQVRMTLRRVKDPELSLNIVDLGLVYDVRIDGSVVSVDMSLTSPGCPSGPEIMEDADRQLRTIPGVSDVKVNLVWTPFWSPDRIEPRVRAYLGI